MSDAVWWWRCLEQEIVYWRSSPHAAKEPKTASVQRMPSNSTQITVTMMYTRSSKKHSPAASVQPPARVQKKAVKQEKSGKRTQAAKRAVAPVACASTPVKQASSATVATPKTGKPVAPTLIKAFAADKKVYGANGRRKPAAASGGKVSSTIKKRQLVKASGAIADAKVKSAASKPSRAQTPMKGAQAGAKTAEAKDRK
jgi:hypothetical protein